MTTLADIYDFFRQFPDATARHTAHVDIHVDGSLLPPRAVVYWAGAGSAVLWKAEKGAIRLEVPDLFGQPASPAVETATLAEAAAKLTAIEGFFRSVRPAVTVWREGDSEPEVGDFLAVCWPDAAIHLQWRLRDRGVHLDFTIYEPEDIPLRLAHDGKTRFMVIAALDRGVGYLTPAGDWSLQLAEAARFSSRKAAREAPGVKPYHDVVDDRGPVTPWRYYYPEWIVWERLNARQVDSEGGEPRKSPYVKWARLGSHPPVMTRASRRRNRR